MYIHKGKLSSVVHKAITKTYLLWELLYAVEDYMEEKMEKKEKQRFHKNCKGFYRKYTSTKICKKKKKKSFFKGV